MLQRLSKENILLCRVIISRNFLNPLGRFQISDDSRVITLIGILAWDWRIVNYYTVQMGKESIHLCSTNIFKKRISAFLKVPIDNNFNQGEIYLIV